MAPLGSQCDVAYAGTMEERIAKLEMLAADTRERLARIEACLEHMVTKADLNVAIIRVIKWMVGTAALMAVSGITVMTVCSTMQCRKRPQHHLRPLRRPHPSSSPYRCRPQQPPPNSPASHGHGDAPPGRLRRVPLPEATISIFLNLHQKRCR